MTLSGLNDKGAGLEHSGLKLRHVKTALLETFVLESLAFRLLMALFLFSFLKKLNKMRFGCVQVAR